MVLLGELRKIGTLHFEATEMRGYDEGSMCSGAIGLNTKPYTLREYVRCVPYPID